MDVEETLKLAIEYHNANEIEKADILYNKILEQSVDHPDANHLSGLISLSFGNIEDAIRKIQKAINVLPKQAIYYNSLGNAFKYSDRTEQAECAYLTALEIDPRLHEAHHNLGKILENKGHLENAEYHLYEAVQLAPSSCESNFSLGRILMKLEKFVEAVNFFEKAQRIEPGNAVILNGLAFALEKAGRLDDAIKFYERSIKLEPNELATLSNLGHALHACGRAREALVYLKKCVKIDPENQLNWDRYLFALIFSETSDREVIFNENRRWAAGLENKISPSVDFSNFSLNPNKKIKIGYYSKEFYSHVTSFFFETLLRYHNRDLFEIYCYSDCVAPDEVTAEFEQRSDFWRTVAGLEPHQIAEQIRSDHIDLFVGTTNFLPSNRIVSAHEPAPIIVSYMNQVSSTGLSNVDYLITDHDISPVETADHFFVEDLIRLSNFICYFPPNLEVEVKPAPAIKNGYVTFGCFNNLAKLNQTVISTWSEILLSLPNSRIMLVAGGFHDKTMRARFLKLFADCGINQERIEIISTILGREKYLEQYNLIDIALDPFPFTGGTVTDEAIYMSVPMVTLGGNFEMGRMGLSKLSSLNLYHLIAQNTEDYCRIAIQLASDIGQIQEHKTQIRPHALETIFNGAEHVKELEQAFRKIWQRYCNRNS